MPFSKLELGLLALETSVFFAHNVQQGLLGLQDFDEGAFSFGDGLVVISFSDVLLLVNTVLEVADAHQFVCDMAQAVFDDFRYVKVSQLGLFSICG